MLLLSYKYIINVHTKNSSDSHVHEMYFHLPVLIQHLTRLIPMVVTS